MGDLSNEPSMEDILSSIKRIIAEEHDGATPGRGRRIGRAAVSPEPESEPNADTLGREEEAVLELDHPVPAPEAPAEPASRSERPSQVEQEPEMSAPHDRSRPAVEASDDAILSDRVAQATRGRIESLTRMVVKPDVAGSDTLEGLVREMLRPMLSQWLDAHLPGIVETIVSREIARISGRTDL
ncbi:DUF2497 domain-containing protein [Sphingomonas sp.]